MPHEELDKVTRVYKGKGATLQEKYENIYISTIYIYSTIVSIDIR